MASSSSSTSAKNATQSTAERLEPVPERVSFPKLEEQMLAFWKKVDAFQASVKKSEGKPEYSFYDGPPFATGLPHYGHLLCGTIKDVVTRYAHQTGHHVVRRFGWDTHGLPIEFEIDKKFGVKTREDVLKMGIDRYNEECRSIVMTYANEWEHIVTRMGRWIDFRNDYKTLNLSFMESVWWVFAECWKRKVNVNGEQKPLIYRDFKVMPFSTGCTTPLSNFEAGMNYKDVPDPAIVVSFPLVDDPQTCLLAWTTTPWTLPSNLALCVHPDFDYVTVLDKVSGKRFVVLQSRLNFLYKSEDEYQLLPEVSLLKGKDLVGKKYVPLFNYFVDKFGSTAFRVVADTYVTNESGVGIVHQAPAFGEDDHRVCLLNKVVSKGDGVPCPVDDSGRFTSEVTDWQGMYVKEADKLIKDKLKQMGRLVRNESIVHSVPFCWRSETPLLYKAVPSWFLRVEAIRDRLVENNKKTYWVPDFVQEKRFHNWLSEARDWAISRNRYWGTPIPVWVSADGTQFEVMDSVAKLEQLSGVKGITDLHRHKIDHITIPDPRGPSYPPMHRVEEVFDCWFESGAMPYAQLHYPFENKKRFEESFPADFIAEGLDQTRGWFYTLMVLSTALFDKPAFKNLIVNGLVLAADGKKMSKRLKNYPDPMLITSQHGADSLRLYLMNSPVVRAEPLRFREDGVAAVVRDVLLPWFNAYRFFVENCTENFRPNLNSSMQHLNVMDKWILAATQSLVAFVRQEMAAYRLYTVVPRLVSFVDLLTNWYVRFNRKRFKGDTAEQDRVAALNVLCEVLVCLCKMMAPFTPFFTEYLWQNLKRLFNESDREDSVHYLMFPEPRREFFNEKIETAVSRLRSAILLGRTCRDHSALSLKKPLKEVIVISKNPDVLRDLRELQSYLQSELNVVKVTLTNDESLMQLRVEGDQKLLGTRLRKDLPPVNRALAELKPADIGTLQQSGKLTLTIKNDNSSSPVEINISEVKVIRQFRSPNSNSSNSSTSDNYVSESDTEMIVVFDVSEDKALTEQWHVREFVNRIQKLRKKALLRPTDLLEVYYSVPQNTPLYEVLLRNRATIEKQTKCSVVPFQPHQKHAHQKQQQHQHQNKDEKKRDNNNDDNNTVTEEEKQKVHNTSTVHQQHEPFLHPHQHFDQPFQNDVGLPSPLPSVCDEAVQPVNNTRVHLWLVPRVVLVHEENVKALAKKQLGEDEAAVQRVLRSLRDVLACRHYEKLREQLETQSANSPVVVDVDGMKVPLVVNETVFLNASAKFNTVTLPHVLATASSSSSSSSNDQSSSASTSEKKKQPKPQQKKEEKKDEKKEEKKQDGGKKKSAKK